MLFVQCDDVVQDFPPATSDPALRYSILPGRANARPLGLQTSRLQERNDLMVELRVPIQQIQGKRGIQVDSVLFDWSVFELQQPRPLARVPAGLPCAHPTCLF